MLLLFPTPLAPYLPSLLALAGIHVLAAASPGPAFVATVQISVQHSRGNALLHSVGLGLAAVVWAAAAILGLQALMLRMIWLYRLLQFAGGVYLLYVGIQAWRHARDTLIVKALACDSLSSANAFRRGFATNIANPKVMVYFASIFAALLNPGWPFWVRAVVLAMVAAIETGWFAALALVLSTRRAQSAWQRAKATLDRAAGSVMIFFGGKLIWSAAR